MKIIRCATIGLSLNIFCKGILQDLKDQGYEVVAVSSPDEDLKQVAAREDVRTIGVEMERKISLVKDMKALWTLYRVFRAEKPDMVHSMTPKAGLLCMMAAWMARVPYRVHTFTGLIWPTTSGIKRKILMMTDKITCACATHVIPESLGVLDDLKNYGITKKPMRLLGYGNVKGVDLSFWQKPEMLGVRSSQPIARAFLCSWREDEALAEGSKSEEFGVIAPDGKKLFTFLFVGRIVGDKGINELVAAFNKLIERKKEKGEGRSCRLVLVGWIEDHLDPVTPETRHLIDTMPEIEAVGPKPVEDLLAYYAASDCFVFPSYREGFPNTVLEAGAMELASIVTDINGCRDIILKAIGSQYVSQHLQPGETMSIRENGVMVPSKDADALYEAMCWMMEHEEERLQMGKRARQIISERWEQGFVREKLYEFYREVLSERG